MEIRRTPTPSEVNAHFVPINAEIIKDSFPLPVISKEVMANARSLENRVTKRAKASDALNNAAMKQIIIVGEEMKKFHILSRKST